MTPHKSIKVLDMWKPYLSGVRAGLGQNYTQAWIQRLKGYSQSTDIR